MTLVWWALAVAGSALILTQSAIARPIRERIALEAERRTGRVQRALRGLSTLVHCPMCAGAWLGALWALAAGFGAVGAFWLFWAGSYVAAVSVALWQALSEAHQLFVLWRFLQTPTNDP